MTHEAYELVGPDQIGVFDCVDYSGYPDYVIDQGVNMVKLQGAKLTEKEEMWLKQAFAVALYIKSDDPAVSDKVLRTFISLKGPEMRGVKVQASVLWNYFVEKSNVGNNEFVLRAANHVRSEYEDWTEKAKQRPGAKIVVGDPKLTDPARGVAGVGGRFAPREGDDNPSLQHGPGYDS